MKHSFPLTVISVENKSWGGQKYGWVNCKFNYYTYYFANLFYLLLNVWKVSIEI